MPNLRLLGALVAAGIFSLPAIPALAAGPPSCTPISAAVAAAEKLGGYMVALVDIPGEDADQLLIAVVEGAVQVWPAKSGCLVMSALPLLKAKEKGTPA